MSDIEKVIEPNLPDLVRYKDKVAKTPKFTKKGEYTAAATARMLTEYLNRPVNTKDTAPVSSR